MSIIQCDEDCIYQHDGYCSLEMPSAITNYTGDGCVHCIKVTPRAPVSNQIKPQTPPSRL
ncbi:hypothetical protein [Clostridium sp. KNHs216]|jgi:hypothetical protein|uniref:hypothetical protein n=1 Tax=Eubacteriales TaxID=186802 RepID=UPI00114E048B|nr:hypothetical protein [Clostridium sp. KNHs216]MBE6830695.1 hypothetical protein [Oscillospiraceae bacterium]TQI65725.1 hypothetical protein LY85_0368 [Clostridium sp. KNHs216]